MCLQDQGYTFSVGRGVYQLIIGSVIAPYYMHFSRELHGSVTPRSDLPPPFHSCPHGLATTILEYWPNGLHHLIGTVGRQLK
jgi:hypothetical protein